MEQSSFFHKVVTYFPYTSMYRQLPIRLVPLQPGEDNYGGFAFSMQHAQHVESQQQQQMGMAANTNTHEEQLTVVPMYGGSMEMGQGDESAMRKSYAFDQKSTSSSSLEHGPTGMRQSQAFGQTVRESSDCKISHRGDDAIQLTQAGGQGG